MIELAWFIIVMFYLFLLFLVVIFIGSLMNYGVSDGALDDVKAGSLMVGVFLFLGLLASIVLWAFEKVGLA